MRVRDSHRLRRRSFLAALAATCLPIPGGGRAQTAAPVVTPEMIIAAAELLFARELERANAKRSLDVDRATLSLARRLTRLLLEYAPTFAPIATGWAWTIHVETREEPVAYCLPGGKLMLSTGLVNHTRLTPGELAVVLAHAIAHALSGLDVVEATARLAALRESPDPNRRVLQLVDILGAIVLRGPHDKSTERAIDAMTLEFMARSGVDPEPAVEAWRKIARAGGATPPGFLALHPVWPGRIEEIDAQLPAILPLYEQTRAEHAARGRVPPVRTRPGLN